MAITSAFCTSAKAQFLSGSHTPLHTYKIALFTSAATLNASTTTYSSTNEVAAGGNYTQGGIPLTVWSSSFDSGVGFITFTNNPSWANATITANGALIWNTSGSQSIAAIAFGSDVTSTNGTFTVNLPAATSAAALIRIG